MAEPEFREEGIEWGEAVAEVGRGKCGGVSSEFKGGGGERERWSGCIREDESKRPTLGSVWILNIQGSILLWK